MGILGKHYRTYAMDFWGFGESGKKRETYAVQDFVSLVDQFMELLGIRCALEVVPCEGWSRAAWFDETGLPWVMPSPNMPTLDTAIVYPGTVMMEGTNISEGRGTTRPFEIVGAPWIAPERFGDGMNRLEIPGVRGAAPHPPRELLARRGARPRREPQGRRAGRRAWRLRGVGRGDGGVRR